MGNFVVYKSSAGSGKTYTLVKEYLKLTLADPHRLHSAFRHVLAITFTNKAAAEMKERVLKALLEISAGQETSLASDLQREMNLSAGDLQARCEELHTHLLHHYADFAVSTIDSFVYRIVRRFSLDLKLPANFSVELDEETALWWAIDHLQTEMESNPAVSKLLKDYAEEKVEEQKNWNVSHEIFELTRSVLIAKKDQSGSGLLQEGQISGLLGVKEELKRRVREVDTHFTVLAQKAFQLMEKNGVTANDFYHTTSGVPGFFTKILNKKYDDEKLVNSYVLKALNEDVWYSGKNPKPGIDRIKADLTGLINEVEMYKDKVSKEYYLNVLLLKNINALCVLSEVKLLVDKYKAERNIVFISEFNKAVAEFIREEPVPYIYERLGDRYKHYLVDEFQDTSALQWLNLLPLIHNSLAEGKLCMVVGDGKQSIYRWRGADVTQFALLPHIENAGRIEWIAEQQEALVQNYIEKNLNVNRRSREGVINFNNSLFDDLASKHLQEPSSKVYEGGRQLSASKKGGSISMQFVRKEKEEAVKAVLEATYALIERALKNGYSYADVALLVRKNQHGNELANYLLGKGVPVISSDSLLLKNCPEVNFINSFLAWLINPGHAVAATAVLSYLHYAQEHLLQIARMPYSLSALLAQQDITLDTTHLASLSLYELCTEVVRIFDLENRNPLYLNFFIDEVSNFAQRESNSVFEFLTWWAERSDKLSVKIPANTNAVKVLTIHASKGLEFPVVVFPFADWKTDRSENILIDTSDKIANMPVALVSTGNALKRTVFSAASEEEEQKQVLDNLNLLYVACTRAVDELHIISRVPQKGGGTLANWLLEHALSQYGFAEAEGTLELGEPKKNEEQRKFDLSTLAAPQYRPLHEAVTIKLSDHQSDKNSRRLFGIAMHNLLSDIKTQSDTEAALQKALLNGSINAAQAPALKELIMKLTGHELLRNYFSSGVQVRNETELFVPGGEVLRPDRVVICEDHLAVIDFKTGDKKKEHIVQVQDYSSALQAISGKEVRRFLVYLLGNGQCEVKAV